MREHEWVEEFPASITVSDPAGVILEMNACCAKAFEKDGGKKLLGTNMFDCHPEPAKSRLRYLMETQRTNIYTTEKNGVKRLVCQAPWQKDGQYAGFVEIVITLPEKMPHFVRK
ncbi:MAG: diguanylate cyclase [Planctomycetota bacterium]